MAEQKNGVVPNEDLEKSRNCEESDGRFIKQKMIVDQQQQTMKVCANHFRYILPHL